MVTPRFLVDPNVLSEPVRKEPDEASLPLARIAVRR